MKVILFFLVVIIAVLYLTRDHAKQNQTRERGLLLSIQNIACRSLVQRNQREIVSHFEKLMAQKDSRIKELETSIQRQTAENDFLENKVALLEKELELLKPKEPAITSTGASTILRNVVLDPNSRLVATVLSTGVVTVLETPIVVNDSLEFPRFLSDGDYNFKFFYEGSKTIEFNARINSTILPNNS